MNTTQTALKDPYQLEAADIAEPPRALLDIFRRIGPGIILAASIVGSGELIATTTLGAQVGYTAMWVIVLSCLIKPVVQAELGRYTIATGETGLAGFNLVPGPRWKVNWIVWAWAAMTLMTQLQIGAMFGGVSQVMHQLVPAVAVNMWVLVFLGITLALLLGGGYARIEGLAMIKVGLFTLLTFLAAVVLTRMPQYFNWADVWQGFNLRLPGEGLSTAVAVFGITGVGASELFMYPYWCVEKGYARYAGKRDRSPEWRVRAQGWIRVMHIDILSSMVIYTVATIAFYLLGAGILHGMGKVPAAKDMISVLSNIYTQTLGPWSLWVFYLGAIATLYGTIFAATAANSRVYADMFRLMGFFDHTDYAARVRYRRAFVLFLTIFPVCLFMLVQSPVKMVVAGGVAQSLMLPIIGIGTLYLRHRHLPGEVLPPGWVTAALWGATGVILLLMGYYTVLTLQ
ncbi:MAG: Nramp family divalent metal transporter [Acidobacteria bacterium]|nr:Nramp family divalent metal transporter [Acidobacteriota bacterium]MCI0717851.1 Nramp family divalent metal transporter [Acidobacteriota bacterium]